MKGVELNLPEFAFVESSGHDGDKLQGRNVILHVRSASVLEVLETDKVYLKEDIISFDFHNTNKYFLYSRTASVSGAVLVSLYRSVLLLVTHHS